MGRDLEDILRTAEEGGSELWYKLRAQAVANTHQAYERGRQVYDDAVRTGRQVVAQTPSEVARLGRAANAVVRSAGNRISLDQADKLEALTEASLGAGQGDFGQRYNQRLALQRQADADAQREFPNLYKWSGDAADLAGILAMDSPTVASGAARLLPGGAKLVEGLETFRPVGFIREGYGRMAAGLGGAVNAAAQAGDDVLNGRPVTFGKEVDAFASGAAGTAAATHGRPALGAAIGAGLNTALQEGDQGRPSVDDVLDSGLASSYAGRGFATLGQAASNALPMGIKKQLGEGLTFMKSWARGEPIPPWQVRNVLAVADNLPGALSKAGPQVPIKLSNGRTTVADWNTLWGRALEAKFGLSAELRRAQRLAPFDLYPNYLPDHWSPGNVGDIAGGAFGSASGYGDPADRPQ
jgi:hypothetical protein